MPVLLPDTPDNRILSENVHPTDWMNPDPAPVLPD